MKNREKYRDEIVEAIREDDAIDEKLVVSCRIT